MSEAAEASTVETPPSGIGPRERCLMGKSDACEFEILTGGVDRSGLVGDVSVARCRVCGVGFSQPPLPDVAFLYADRSSQDFQPNTKGLARFIKHLAFGLQARRMLSQIAARPTLVVDFACGSGLFTRRMADSLGPSARVVGADFHGEGPAELGGLEYRPIHDLADLAGQADLVLAMHVVEHDDDPRGLLARIAALAKPGGKLVIEVPNIDCVWAGVFGRHWDAWYLPYHRTHFSRDSLRALIRSEGLIVEREIGVSLPTMGRTVANLFGQRNSLAFILIGVALHSMQWLGELVTGRPAALRMIARKV
jgi:SAM-dependent methyltransferase